MPDEQLLELAGRGELRANLDAQLQRMLADPRSEAFVRDFTGQWLQARDVRDDLDRRRGRAGIPKGMGSA